MAPQLLVPSRSLWQPRPGIFNGRGRRAIELNAIPALSALPSGATITHADTSFYVGSDGLFKVAGPNGLRFDHDPKTLVPRGLLVELASTNICLRSEQYDNAAWTKVRVTIGTGETDLFGTTAAQKFIEDGTSLSKRVVQSITFVSGTTYCFSAFVKADERPAVQMSLTSASAFPANTIIVFNMSTGTVLNTFGSPVASGAIEYQNGWWRVFVCQTANASAASEAQLYIHDGTATSYAGDSSSGIIVYGSVVEAGTFPTSYNQTGAVADLRAEDIFTLTGLDNVDHRFTVLGGKKAEVRDLTVSGGAQQIIAPLGSNHIERVFKRTI